MIRILLAEDEEAMRTYQARALENAGYEVVSLGRMKTRRFQWGTVKAVGNLKPFFLPGSSPVSRSSVGASGGGVSMAKIASDGRGPLGGAREGRRRSGGGARAGRHPAQRRVVLIVAYQRRRCSPNPATARIRSAKWGFPDGAGGSR